jgi:hypothetical protein
VGQEVGEIGRGQRQARLDRCCAVHGMIVVTGRAI